jgi:hypothetical protein
LIVLALLLSSAILVAFPVAGASTETSTVSVTSQNTGGTAISGYRTILYASNGSAIAEGFTPSTFTTTVGQTYGVRAESYGSCAFTMWSDGVTSDPRTYTATSSAMSFIAVYDCAGEPQPSSVTVDTVNQAGAAIKGFRTVLYSSGGSILSESFSPNTFATTSGTTYGVRAESYGSCNFEQWSDGVTSDPRTFTATGSPVTFTADYNCAGVSQTSSVTVNSENQDDAVITGYTVTLTPSGGTAASGFTPATFTTTSGISYSLLATNSGGSCTFTEWSDGVTSNPRTFTASATAATYTAVYDCPVSQASTATVDTVNQAGAAITGFRTVLYSSTGSIVSEGFSPSTFTTTSGTTYGIRAESYGECTFTKWSDGVTSDPRTFTAGTASATFTADYNCASSTPTTSVVTINSIDRNYSDPNTVVLTGFSIVVGNTSGSAVAIGYTPLTFTATIGQTYTISGGPYGRCAFTGWSTGVNSTTISFTASSSPATITEDFDCHGPTTPTSTSSVSFYSINQFDAAVKGMQIGLYLTNGTLVDSGVTPFTYTTVVGQTYVPKPLTTGDCTFANWSSNGGLEYPVQITAAGPPAGSPQEYVAQYSCSGATQPSVHYDEQIGMTFTQNSTSLGEYVAVIAQNDSDGYGPAYLLNGISNNGDWYQVGVSFDWPGSRGGFDVEWEIWAPNDTVIEPSTYDNWATLRSSNQQINNNDTIELTMNIVKDDVWMNVSDPATGMYYDIVYYHSASYFVGTKSSSNAAGFFTGLMTEEYHSASYTGGEIPVVYWTSIPRNSTIMWADEELVTGTTVTPLWGAASGLVLYTTQDPAWSFSYDGAQEYSTAYELVTGET